VNQKLSGPTFLSIFIHFYRPNLHFYDLSSFERPVLRIPARDPFQRSGDGVESRYTAKVASQCSPT
jgi:hypothetical protein